MAARSCHNGSQEACGQAKTLAKEAAVEAGIEITIGSLVPGSKAAVDLIQWVRKNADGKTVRAIDKATNRPIRSAKPGTIQRGFHSSGYRSEFYNAAGNPTKWRNPETGKLEKIPADAVFHKDHVFPLAGIRGLDGFNDLSPYQKASLLTDPKNYQPLLGSMNCSKGCRVVGTANDWKTYKGQPLNEGYRKWLEYEQREMTRYFERRIKDIVAD